MSTVAITREQSRDTGLAIVLVLLLVVLRWQRGELLIPALIIQVVSMVAPQVLRPVAIVWFGVAHLLGAVVSRVMLTAVFGLVVTPIGLLRRALAKDSLRLRAFKAGDESVMVVRNQRFTAGDLEKPF